MSERSQAARVGRYAVALMVAWTGLLGSSFTWQYFAVRRQAVELGLAKAVTAFEWGRLFRTWVSRQGGVYAAVSDRLAPNSLLAHVTERDVQAPSGRQLTKVNAAYMARLVFESIDRPEQLGRGRLVSLRPLNPANAPDPWEEKALHAFEAGAAEVSETLAIDGRLYMRLLRASKVEKSCLDCHEEQGYRIGDVRGGVGVTVPISDILEAADLQTHRLAAVHGLLWVLGLGLIGFGGRRVSRAVLSLETSRAALQGEVVERQRLAQARADSERFLKTVIEAEPECVKLLDAEGRLVMMNRQGLSMLDADSEEAVLGQCVYPLVAAPHREAFQALTRRVYQGGEGTLEFEAIGLKGRHVWLETHAVPLRNDSGEIVWLLGITRDITDHKQAQDQLATKVRELEKALSQVKLLEGIIPICAGCKKIRDDKDSWHQIESYISEHSEAQFSHGLCPACLERTMKDMGEL